MGSDHASPEYLAGLSDLDRARAIVAVRWCEARWVNATFTNADGNKFKPDARRLHPEPEPDYYVDADSSTPIDSDRWLASRCLDSDFNRLIDSIPTWGESWQGTASLMKLAESKGWELDSADWDMENPEYAGQHFVVLYKNQGASTDYERGTAFTIHAAVLLACAAAAMREDNDATR